MRPEGGMAAGRGAASIPSTPSIPSTTAAPAPTDARGRGANRPRSPIQIVEVDLAKLFSDSEAGTMKAAGAYERVCGTIAPEMMAGGDMAIDWMRQMCDYTLHLDDYDMSLTELATTKRAGDSPDLFFVTDVSGTRQSRSCGLKQL